ncbi:hypothetical protein H310_00060 [Aphanomyces invadans]|uniref:Arf-GAP domain-containing protein n=1 Tax=Aphanomyces invadans TaxID=157072 RepID=A0A024UU70_9STRA|nr:hypothetical protein H310_00060 [Aphanomyces invadans]ETW09490.1 hypothetical protein H310_00060 [Aphanomyces invadans]|eukprot:XP_008860901.1 hypothetical protein H310_00060 [Aphanomyces invadans]
MAHQMDLSVQQELRKLPGNNKCVDCDAPYPQWATVSYGTFMCLECSGRHRGLGVHLSFVRSVSMDSWTDKQIRLMQLGGNDHFRSEFDKAGVPKTLSIAQKYNTPQAEAFRNRLNALVEGTTPAPLPRWDPSSLPSGTGGASAGDAKGVEALKGETEQEYVARQLRLREEARARMAAKFGSGGMQGIGSGGPTTSSSSSGSAGGGYADVTSSLGSAFSLLSTTVTSAASSAANLVKNPELTNTVSSSWSTMQAKLTDPELTNTVKSTASSSWSYLTTTTSSLLKNAQSLVDPNAASSSGGANDGLFFPRTNPNLPETSKYEGIGASTLNRPAPAPTSSRTASFDSLPAPPAPASTTSLQKPEPLGSTLAPLPVPAPAAAPKKEVKKDVDFFGEFGM